MKTTPLYKRHCELGAQMTEFAGYQMPVRYTGDKLEHNTVRQKAGIFDVSHMGEIWVSGPQAENSMLRLFTQEASRYKPGQAFYALMLNPDAGVIDDVIAYKFASDRFLICVNASNTATDYAWIQNNCDALVQNVSEDFAQIALQGPEALSIAAKLFGSEIWDIKRFRFLSVKNFIIARTGYTGEDGFEIFCPTSEATELWNLLAEEALPSGLAARDTLRLEAGMCLYGHELTEQITPLEANLNWCVQFERKTPFIGQEYLFKQAQAGVSRKLSGLIMQSNSIARPDYEVFNPEEKKIGFVTSGTKTPFLNQAIAMAYVDMPYCDGTDGVYVKIRGNLEPALITKLPFYRKNR